MIEEFKKKTRIDRARGLRPEGIPDLRRGSEMVPESHGLPKMSLGDFKLIVVLGKGSFGKASRERYIERECDSVCVCTGVHGGAQGVERGVCYKESEEGSDSAGR